MRGTQVTGFGHRFFGGLVMMVALAVVFGGASIAGASKIAAGVSQRISIPENIQPLSNVVLVETNRWKPGKCMWLTKKEHHSKDDLQVVFPFAELANAVCHILVAVSDSHICYIHLTPLTSFFRQDTSELKKIIANLKNMSGKNEKWTFKVFYFEDNGRESKFRTVIGKALGKAPVSFTAITPEAYAGGEVNLIMTSGQLSYSVRNLDHDRYIDASAKGVFNRIPISAIE